MDCDYYGEQGIIVVIYDTAIV